jgi:hypothetical protein
VGFALLIVWAIWLLGLHHLVVRWFGNARRPPNRSIADEAEAWLSRQWVPRGDSPL